MERIEGTFEVICIEAFKGELTENKKYIVKQCEEFTNHYELINDLGTKESYFKSRFKIVEGENMEEVIKVRCIKNGQMQQLALKIGKDYDAIESPIIKGAYQVLIDDSGRKNVNFSKDWFEKVTDDILMVECINNKDCKRDLTIGKKYPVIIDSWKEFYNLTNDLGIRTTYKIDRFKPAEPQKEDKKEYSVMELFEEKEETRFKIEGLDYEYFVLNGILRRTIDRTTGENIYLNKAILKAKFIKVEEPKQVTTSEAMKALEEGRTIESVHSKYKYKKVKGKIMIETDVTRQEKRGFVKFTYFQVKEIENLWIIL